MDGGRNNPPQAWSLEVFRVNTKAQLHRHCLAHLAPVCGRAEKCTQPVSHFPAATSWQSDNLFSLPQASLAGLDEAQSNCVGSPPPSVSRIGETGRHAFSFISLKSVSWACSWEEDWLGSVISGPPMRVWGVCGRRVDLAQLEACFPPWRESDPPKSKLPLGSAEDYFPKGHWGKIGWNCEVLSCLPYPVIMLGESSFSHSSVKTSHFYCFIYFYIFCITFHLK